MSATTIEKAGLLTGRQVALVAVVGLHALAIGALMTATIVIERNAPQSFRNIHIAPQPVVEPPPRIALRPDVAAVPRWSPPEVPAPQILHEQPMRPAPETAILLRVPETPAGPTPVGPPAEPTTTPLQHRTTRSPDDYYPATSLRMQEQGDVVVRVCVGTTGRHEGAPRVERSSGSRRLDDAAVKWASEALEFTPATRDGAAVPACKGFRVNFTLQ